MNILSNWKLTYDPTGTPAVLLDYGAELAEEPEFSLRRGLDVIRIPYGIPFLRPTLHDVYEVLISIEHSSETDANARRDMVEQLTDFYDQTTKMPMRLEASGLTTRRYQWASSFIHTASVRRAVNSGGDGEAKWLLKIGFTAVGMTKTIL